MSDYSCNTSAHAHAHTHTTYTQQRSTHTAHSSAPHTQQRSTHTQQRSTHSPATKSGVTSGDAPQLRRTVHWNGQNGAETTTQKPAAVLEHIFRIKEAEEND